MFKYEITFQKPNNPEWYNLTRWTLPFTDGTTLDDTLDEGKVNLSCTKRQNRIPPFSKIKIKIFESQRNGEYAQVGEINRVIGTSRRIRRTFARNSPTLWDWDIQTLEETKLLERYVCDSMMSTNYLSKDYADGRTDILIPIMNGRAQEYLSKNDTELYGPVKLNGEFYVPSFWSLYDFRSAVGHLVGTCENESATIIAPDGTEIKDVMKETITFTQTGTYTLKYDGSVYVGAPGYGQSLSGLTVTYTIGVFENITPRTQPTITSVCERLLSAGITRRQGIDAQKFTLDTVFAAKYANVPAPEFSFTRQTLFEALLTVGGYIHAIPRLNGNVVTFDELGGDDEIDMTNFPKMVYEDRAQDINDFSSTIDSPAQNLINTQDRIRGSITELGNDYITVRAEDAEVIIEANTAIIRTSLPINQIIKLECGFIPDRETPVGDISAYVYEAAEYDTLSSFWDSAYPYSKGFALRYVQGDNKITGLQTKLEYPTSVQKDLANPAIINIIQAVAKQKIESTDIFKLAFRVTYVPIVTSRVTQRKPYGNTDGASNGAGWDNALVYNQGGNTMESTFYGDKMKGAIARLGNEVVQRTYDFVRYNQIPKCGQKLDGMYVARVDCEYDITRIRATVTLTKDFNMLSQYVGLNSNYRLYDISEKQSVERFINYSENCYVGNQLTTEQSSQHQPILNPATMTLVFMHTLGGDYLGHPKLVLVDGQDKDGNAIGKSVVLPVVTFGFGNSLVFAFSMYDNYGAGFQNSNLYDNSNYKGVQRLVPYSDGLGEIEYLSFTMAISGWTPNAEAQAEGGYANLYPEYLEGSVYEFTHPGTALISTGGYPLIVKKDSREALSVVYQAHFVANRQSIVLGPALSGSNMFTGVTAPNKRYYLYFFKKELNMLNQVLDLEGLHNAGGYSVVVGTGNAFTIDANKEGPFDCTVIKGIVNSSDYTCKAWGIVEVDSESAKQGRLFIGENVELVPGQPAPEVFFTMRSNE